MGTDEASPLVILNPAANRGNMHLYRQLLRSRASAEHCEYRETSQQGDAKNWAMQAAQEDRPVIIVGGDGSLNEAVNGILCAGRKVPLGIIPAGSGNDFAWYTLGLPRDPHELIEKAFHGRLVDADAGMVNGRYFVNSFGVGLDADIAVAAGDLKKFPLMSGERLYYASILRQLLFGYHRCPWLKFSLDDGQQEISVAQHYILFSVTNGPTYGAGFRINPHAIYDDGFFDICAIDYMPQVRAIGLLSTAKKGEHVGLPIAHFYRARKLHIESREPVNMLLDGETGRDTCFDAAILPGALWVRI